MEILTNNGNMKITFSVSEGGNFNKTVETRHGVYIRSTRSVGNFVKMMIDTDFALLTWSERQIQTAEWWWRNSNGRFNAELYRRIKEIRAKQ